MKSECPTFLRLKGKVMAVTLSDGEVSNHESGSDEDRNFFAFTAIAAINESDFGWRESFQWGTLWVRWLARSL